MSITQEQKDIVQATFAQVTDADQLATRFYDHLFETDPSTKPLFRHDMAEQRQKLLQTIAVVVNDLGTIVPAVQSLGRRHVAYGVTVQHWDSVGNSLLWALEDTFGEAFTSEVHDAWAAAYGLIANTAIEAAYTPVESN